jgi:hypothetical protein
MEDPDFGYTIDQHLAPTGAAALELASVGHRRILARLSSCEDVSVPTQGPFPQSDLSRS